MVKRSIREAMVFHMECLLDSNLPIPEPGRFMATVTVPVPGVSGSSKAAMQYLVVIEPAGDEWSAHAPDVFGCTARGRTRSEAEHAIQQALATCLSEMRVRGGPVTVPGRRTALIVVEVPQAGVVLEPSVREAR